MDTHFTYLSYLTDPDLFYKIHPFNRTDFSLPFTMVQCTKATIKSSHILYLNHTRHISYLVLFGKVVSYSWKRHTLHFVAGVDDIYTVVHESNKGIKVPCCYDTPDYLASRKDPDKKMKEAIAYLGWDLIEPEYTGDQERIIRLVKDKIKVKGWNGGTLYG